MVIILNGLHMSIVCRFGLHWLSSHNAMNSWTPRKAISYQKLQYTVYCTLYCTLCCTVLYNKLYPGITVGGWPDPECSAVQFNVQYSVQYSIQYSVQYSIQYTVQWIVQLGVEYNVRGNLQEAGTLCSFRVRSASNFIPGTVYCIVLSTVQCTVYCIQTCKNIISFLHKHGLSQKYFTQKSV